jgi:hypothetical protein
MLVVTEHPQLLTFRAVVTKDRWRPGVRNGIHFTASSL